MDVYGVVRAWEDQPPLRKLIGRVEDHWLIKARWLVAVGAVLIQLALGAIYAWGVFAAALTDADGPFGFSTTQTQWVFSLGLATFAVVTIFAGRLEARIGPRPVAILGGLLLATGYGLAGTFADSFWPMMIFIGLMGGAGIGLAYVVPIAVGMRWFPDRRGLITGLAVAGFGFGALLWVQLAGSWGNLLAEFGVQRTLLIYSFAFGGLVHLGGVLMASPPAGWRPEGWNPVESYPGAARGNGADMAPSGMLRTPQFYVIWLAFTFSAMAGLMLIGINKLYGRDALFAGGGFADLAAAGAAASMAYALAFALANGVGRIGWGMISDRIGWKYSIVVMTSVQGAAMIVFYFLGGNIVMLYVLLAITGFNFGGNFALFPIATAGTFGTKTVGLNYGWMFTAYGIGGIAGPIMAGMFKDAGLDQGVDAWMLPFLIAGGLCVVAAMLVTGTRPPARGAPARN